jgi:hypothetical protein
MPGNGGFQINGVARTFRDRREAEYQAARYLKTRHPKDFVEVLDCATGTKLIVFEDGPHSLTDASKSRRAYFRAF